MYDPLIHTKIFYSSGLGFGFIVDAEGFAVGAPVEVRAGGAAGGADEGDGVVGVNSGIEGF